MSLEKSDSLDDESDSGSAGTCTFPFPFDDSVGGVHGVGYSVFVPAWIDSNCDVVMLVVFIAIGFEYKGGQLIEILCRPKS